MLSRIITQWLGRPKHFMNIIFSFVIKHGSCTMYWCIVILKDKVIQWKMLSNNRPKFIIKDFSILFTMVLPLTIVKIPGPFQHKHPQIIRLTLANRPGLMHCGTHSTPGLRHTRLFSPMNTLHSSGYITQLQSRSTFQCLFSLAHATRFFMLTSRYVCYFLTTRLWYLLRNKHIFTVASETGFSLKRLNLWISFKGSTWCVFTDLKLDHLSWTLGFFFLPPGSGLVFHRTPFPISLYYSPYCTVLQF